MVSQFVPSETVAVHCKEVSKSYLTGGTRTHALRDATLDVNIGELFMLVGPSGCGKTTLISVIAGILNHDSGDCNIFGKNLKQMSEAQRTSYRGSTVGFVFQSFNLLPTLTTVVNVSIPLLLNGVGRREARDRAAEMITKVGLSDKLKSLPTELSGGQQQRVAIARALVHKPRLIVCDEPTSALDHNTGGEIMQLFREHALNDKRTLIIVTHDSRIFEYADRIAQMDDGVVVGVTKGTRENHA